MAGEPARALVTDQITSSSAIPDEDDPRRAMAVTAALMFLFYIPDHPITTDLSGRVSSFHLTLRKVGVKYECLVL